MKLLEEGLSRLRLAIAGSKATMKMICSAHGYLYASSGEMMGVPKLGKRCHHLRLHRYHFFSRIVSISEWYSTNASDAHRFVVPIQVYSNTYESSCSLAQMHLPGLCGHIGVPTREVTIRGGC